MSDPLPGVHANAGLCARCRFGQPQTSARGSVFWRCLRAEEDPAFRRYPPLPVRACQGFEAPATTPDRADA